MDIVKVLCVDDEPQVLKGISLHLRKGYDVSTATSGQEALELVDLKGPFAVILSDMRMPGMDGAAFLAAARQRAPDSVRMLLTGYADIQSAASAVNAGQIFRFLTKPCPPDVLRAAFEAAVAQHRVLTTERVLLEQTLRGCIKTLTEVLSLTNPQLFGRAVRIRRHVREMAIHLGLRDHWPIEVAAMLAHLGCIALPDELALKHAQGEELNLQEMAMVARVPDITDGLLAHIPRLEPSRQIMALSTKSFGEACKLGADPAILRGACVLKLATDFDSLESSGVEGGLALDILRGRKDRYDQELLRAFCRIRDGGISTRDVREVSLRELVVGMVFVEDVCNKTGLLLVTRGFRVTSSFIERAKNFAPGYMKEPLRVMVRTSPAEEE